MLGNPRMGTWTLWGQLVAFFSSDAVGYLRVLAVGLEWVISQTLNSTAVLIKSDSNNGQNSGKMW